MTERAQETEPLPLPLPRFAMEGDDEQPTVVGEHGSGIRELSPKRADAVAKLSDDDDGDDTAGTLLVFSAARWPGVKPIEREEPQGANEALSDLVRAYETRATEHATAAQQERRGDDVGREPAADEGPSAPRTKRQSADPERLARVLSILEEIGFPQRVAFVGACAVIASLVTLLLSR